MVANRVGMSDWRSQARKRLGKIKAIEEKTSSVSQTEYVRLECSVCALAIGLIAQQLLKRSDIRFSVNEDRLVLCCQCSSLDKVKVV